MTKALICIDFINEIVGSDGKLAAKGYHAFVERHGTLGKLAALQSAIRAEGGRVIHVHLGFSPDYADHPAASPLFGGARAGGILQLGSRSTEIVPEVAPRDGDIVIAKKRVSAFYATTLELTLRSLGITEVTIAGVATDIAVQSAARDAHDRDFAVSVAQDASAAASDEDHAGALANLSKIARLV
ncbi:cysteine hydrolase [Phenylobacterium sp. LH3H17]|uniref:cysteine hydrolase family protein n=1 Tax=Phenylobacterium sp. LH3H17 TaxID=2903901 RepID=UPI0020C96102|nr:isochorismatase family cysteine hydrolase [Phenylobacterium sp. LH3H17]UTP39783.1 cysteine hydrolase [Phenylobacterium sp. LH3H17]